MTRSGHRPASHVAVAKLFLTPSGMDRLSRYDVVLHLGGGHEAARVSRRSMQRCADMAARAHAQQPGQLPIIGYMGQGTPAAEAKRVAAFVERLRELSWIEGRTVVIEYRWTDGRSDLAADIAAEFARRKVDIIVTSGTPLIVAAKQATATIPIVFSAAGDPVGSGLVASLARPGGNVTGLSVLSLILRANGSICCVSLFPGCAAWRLWEMLAIRSL